MGITWIHAGGAPSFNASNTDYIFSNRSKLQSIRSRGKSSCGILVGNKARLARYNQSTDFNTDNNINS